MSKYTGKKVIVAGHVCVDITPIFRKDAKYESLSDVFVPGSLIRVENAAVTLGGCVSSTGLAMKKLGADVIMMGKIGKDEFGAIVEQAFRKQGGEGLISDESVSTSYSIVNAVPGFDRMFLHCPGANDTFVCSDISDEALENASLFHFGYPPLMRSMYADNGSELIKIFKKVKSKGLITSLDMAFVDDKSDAGKADWKKIIADVLPYVDIFVPSFEEICYMVDREKFDYLASLGGSITDNLSVERDMKPLADQLIKLGAKTLLLKCGSAGMYYRSGEEEGYQPCFVPDRICSATGAGDTSIAAFLTALSEGRSIRECAMFAAAEGACCVASYDTLSGLLTLDELEEKINSGWATRSC